MAVQTPAVPAAITDDATFRQFVSAVHNAIIAVGLVNTADSGQINEATVLRPAIQTDGGYKVYRFDDAKQATAPVSIYIAYGRAAGNNARLRVQVGTGVSDGFGNVGGRYSEMIIASQNAAAATLAFISGGPNRLSLAYGNDLTFSSQSDNYFGVFIERGRNLDGTENDDVVLLVTPSTPAPTSVLQYVPRGGSGASQVGTSNAVPVLNPAGTTAAFGGDVGVYPITPVVGPNLKGPMLGPLIYVNGDFPLGASINGINHLGAARSYKALSGASTSGVGSGRVAILNE